MSSQDCIYLDTAATAQRPASVLEAVRGFYERDNANPNRGVYDLALRATRDYDRARSAVADFIHARNSREIIFTQNTTESINLLAYSYGRAVLTEGDEIVITISEHHSNLVPWQRLAREKGAKLRYLYTDLDGRIPEESICGTITRKTRLISVAHVSNVLGTIMPIGDIIQRGHEVGAAVVLDCAQSAPHLPLNLASLDVDFAAFSGHKLYGPMGIGVLYGKETLLEQMPPFLSGGDMIETVTEQETTYAPLPRRLEAGTRNVAGAVGLEEAIHFVRDLGWQAIRRQERRLMELTLEGFERIPHLIVYGGTENLDQRVGVLSFNIQGVSCHQAAKRLNERGIAVRAGRHCAQPLFRHMGIDGCVRASFGVYNTEDDVRALLEGLRDIQAKPYTE